MTLALLQDYKNPDLDTSRLFVSLTDRKIKIMIQILHALLQEANPEFRYCAKCHIVAETRAGNRLHKECEPVYTSKQMKGR